MWGITPLCEVVGLVSSDFSNARFTHWSRMFLFHDGSCCPVMYFVAERHVGLPLLRPIAAPDGSLCAHHVRIEGWCPNSDTASTACATARRRTSRAYDHCSGKSCQSRTPNSSAASYSAGAEM